MTTALTTLGADDVHTNVQAFLNVLGVANHVHAEDTSAVELLNDSLGGNTNSRDEELGAALDNDIDELVELALSIVIASWRAMLAGVELAKQVVIH